MDPLPISRIFRHDHRRFPDLNLPAGVLHLWLLSLSGDDALRRTCHQVLSADEQDRARRIIAGPPRDQFLFTRAALRRILGGYLGTSDRALSIATGAHGKPRVVAGSGVGCPSFNVSHSGNLALLAFRSSGQIGVDIEHCVSLGNLMEVAGMTFSAGELALLASKRGDERLTLFYLIWTCKEALLKAEGPGLGRDARSLCLFSGNAPGAAFDTAFSPEAFTVRWSLEVPGCALAWAAEKGRPAVPRWIGSDDLG